MLESLDAKVAEVQRCLVEDRSSNQTTLEKLATIENCMSTVLQGLESMPEEILKMLKKIMDRERRTRSDGLVPVLPPPPQLRLLQKGWKIHLNVVVLTLLFVRHRQREENLREQRLKQEEKLKRYLERSLADCKKMVGLSLSLSWHHSKCGCKFSIFELGCTVNSI